jgi:hypothetical protein
MVKCRVVIDGKGLVGLGGDWKGDWGGGCVLYLYEAPDPGIKLQLAVKEVNRVSNIDKLTAPRPIRDFTAVKLGCCFILQCCCV